MSNEVSTIIDTVNLSTVDNKGNRVSFERSIAFASKDARQALSAGVYARQLDNGVYGPLLRDAMAAGVVSAARRELLEEQLADMGRNPSKEDTRVIVKALVTPWTIKTPKGQKAFYVEMLRTLSAGIRATHVQGDVVAEAELVVS